MKRLGLLLIVLIFTLIACSTNSKNNKPPNIQNYSNDNKNRTTTIQNARQKSIDQISIMMIVNAIKEAHEYMKQIISENDVSIVSLSMQDDKIRKPLATYYLRVPPEKNDAFYHSIKNWEILHKKFNEFLKGTKNIQDKIALEEKISQNEQQQEALKSQLEQLKSQTGYIGYPITLNQDFGNTPTIQQGFIKRIGLALKGTGIQFINLMQVILISLIYLLP